MTPTKIIKVNVVSRVIGDRIKMDVLILLREPCRNLSYNVKKENDCKEMIDSFGYNPSYSTIMKGVRASSSVLLRKLDELEMYGLITSKREPEYYNRRRFKLTPFGEKVADILIELDKIIEKEVGKYYKADGKGNSIRERRYPYNEHTFYQHEQEQ